MFDTKHLFNGALIATIVSVTMYLWIKVYKSIAQEFKKRFIIETSCIFGALFALEYTFVMPYYYDAQATPLEAFYYKFVTALAGSTLTFLVFLIAKFFYVRIPVEKRMRLLCEYAILAAICALLLYVPSNKENLVTPENLEILESAGDYFSEPSRLQNLARLVTRVFFWTSFFAIIRNWICLKMEARKNR